MIAKVIPLVLLLKNSPIVLFFSVFGCVPPMNGNVDVYEPLRVAARTSPNINWLWGIRRIFQVGTDQAIAYI